ncbi:MAG: hypothetical protein CMJ18_01705 [Phycisphaeraceae bacterium]|nr:hypothetical protein [Phycisphaeraceae bacterium]
MIAAVADQCRPVADRMRANYEGYWDRYRLLLAITVAAAVADMISTMHFMILDGIEYELHPGIRLVSHAFGPIGGPMLGKLGQLVAVFVVTLYCRPLARMVFLTASLTYSWAAWYNVTGRELYTPMLFDLIPV